jgi:hypothetical protein
VEITTSLFSLDEKGLAISSLSLEGKGWGMATTSILSIGKGVGHLGGKRKGHPSLL